MEQVIDLPLQKSEARFRRLFETAQDGILLLDGVTGKITDANQFLIDLSGYPHEELLGKNLWELGFLKDIEASKAAFAALDETGYVRYDDLPMEKKDGRKMEVEFISNVYMVGADRVIQCNIRDVSERKQLDRLKDEFLSTVSHEIRTPLSSLKMGIETLEESCIGKCQKAGVEVIPVLKRNVERLMRLVTDLLDLSRFESGQMMVEREMVNIESLIKEATQDFESTAKDHGLIFEVDYDKNLTELMANPQFLIRVLKNLIDNAVRYAKSKITIGVRKYNSDVQIRVGNDGPGIKPEHIGTLFNKFVQINRPMGGRGYQGTGLGLAICSEIIKLHGGKIWAESSDDRGCQFYFRIPIMSREEHEEKDSHHR